MKDILKISLFVFGLVFYACNADNQADEVTEDYTKLFPWQGIDKPENSYEDMNIKTCNTERMLKDYRDLSKDIPNKRTYVVTFECSFNETTSGARYEFRYVDENKKINAIGTKSTQKDISYVLKSGETFTKIFKVQSGYPMYLFVNGGGNMNSGVKAKITAKSEDGLLVVPVLSCQEYQNKRGYNPLPNPYCEYIILP